MDPGTGGGLVPAEHSRLTRPPACRSACAVPVRPGPCKAAIPRWYYNSEAGECVRFTYGGCQGNANNFPTELDCKRACM